MDIKLSNILKLLFLLSIFFIPFDGEGIVPFGEFSSEAYILFLLGFIALYFFSFLFQPIRVPKRRVEYQFLIFFLIISIFSSVLNFPSILDNHLGNKSGLYKLISQFFVLTLFAFPVCIFFYNLFLKFEENLVFSIRKVFVLALYIVFAVGLLEVLWIFFRLPGIDKVLYALDELPLVKITVNTWDKRISSITREPPSLGMFLITILPWILVIKPKSKRILYYFLPLAFILFLSFYSGSRSGIIIILLQLILYVIFNNTKKISFKRLRNIIIIAQLVIMITPLGLLKLKGNEVFQNKIESFRIFENYKSNTSNKTRLGTYIASLEAIKENPLMGVGYGQAGFYIVNDYPFWSANDNLEIGRYRSGERFPPMFNIYLRILVESGFIGLFVFLSFLSFLLYKSIRHYYQIESLEIQKYYLIIIISLIGFGLTWLQFDTFRVLGFWLFFAFYLYVQNKNTVIEKF